MRTFLVGGVGYCISVFVAVAVTFICFATISPDFWYDAKGTLILFCFGLFITGTGALPGFVLALTIQVVKDIKSQYFWPVAGVFAALLTNILFMILLIPFTFVIDLSLLVSTLIGGAVGGYTYSIFHQKMNFSAQRRDAIEFL